MTGNGVWVAVSKVTLISALVYGAWEAFRKRGWRLRVFKGWLVDVPDISGKWTGTAQSTFVEKDGSKTMEIAVTVEIVQTFTSVSIRFTPETGTSTSHSITANFVHNPDAQRFRLVYTYANEPKANESNLDKHFGTVILEIEGTPPSRMKGFYMTDRKTQTKGDLELSRDS